MINTILGKKIRQSQKFTQEGKRLPVTIIEAGPCPILQIKTDKKDHYTAIQIGFGKKKHLNKTETQRAKKAGVEAPRFLREVRIEETAIDKLKPGDSIKVGEVFNPGDVVEVVGISKGKGFAGGVKKWGFHGGPRTHGQSDRERAPGSIGSGTTPGRVYKGKKMAGRMGGDQITIKNLSVLSVDEEKNSLVLTGLVPGAKNSLILIRKVG
ncbi:50S ribosomal protein L3 [Candidatus Microgenomates bacterium]|nr:50S ribosomal protein L3 [Candidatus Microgenomates bacterium]